MNFAELVAPLLRHENLGDSQATELMGFLMGGEATDSQIGAILMALRIKGCSPDELAAFAGVMREKATPLPHSYDDLVDTCGTGGGIESFNISTAAAIVACAAGVRIAKHGNRGITSKCGSADVLECLGLAITDDPERMSRLLDTVGLVFMYAQNHHPAMRFVGKVRKELRVRTVFNQLGPLLNPAGAKRQLIGVFDPSLMQAMGGALSQLGCERALIVHGSDGLDEISPVTSTQFVKVWDGVVTSGELMLIDFGLDPIDPFALKPGASVEENADILTESVSDGSSPRCKAILPSAAAAIWIAGIAGTLPDAVDIARAAVNDGLASNKLKHLVSAGGI